MNLKVGTVTALVGNSGSGKTSILKMIAGLMKADTSELLVENEYWEHSAQKIFLSPQQRSLGFVFQDYSLFPNMTVEKNLLFALPKGGDKSEINRLLAIIQLTELRNKKPSQLSGGQQQRVALARAFLRQPKLLLLDEPLSALDASMREHLQQHLIQFRKQRPVTTLLVSHNVVEVASLADYVYVLENGKVIKEGTPLQVLPKLVGDDFMLKGKVVALDPSKESLTLLTRQGLITLPLLPTQATQITLGTILHYDLSKDKKRTII